MQRAFGLDFGTTNTVMALPESETQAHTVAVNVDGVAVDALRSALCFWKEGGSVKVEAGPFAINRYIEQPEDSRFIQSIKTFAASPHFQGTYIHARRYTFEALMETFLARIFHYAQDALSSLPQRAVVGRPVAFAGSSPDPKLATQRYTAALTQLGVKEAIYVYEPVAAAFFFARALTRPATILVADFGGGTTDFSIMHFDFVRGVLKAEPLGHGGVGIAGDQFDYRIINKAILPEIGKGTFYRDMGKDLELPDSLFASFSQWNMLSVLKSSKEFVDLKKLLRRCLEPEKIERFIQLVEDDQGYPLYRAVSQVKAQLSFAPSATLRFDALQKGFSREITRKQFESWIADDLERIEVAFQKTLDASGLAASKIDKVFLTGGTSFVPAVRAIFERAFGADKIETGNELVSIANGLALIGAREDWRDWAAQT
jgi:hypothetical chaperone protein